MKERDLFLAAYDVRSPDRLRDALYAVKGYATGGQKSAYECFLSPGEKAELLTAMKQALDPDEDAFLLLRLDPRATVLTLGLAVPPLDPPFYFYRG